MPRLKSPHGPVPRIGPKGISVYLDRKLWKALSYTAGFHTAVFAALGSKEKVSRNDIVESLLEWALANYWESRGGVPRSKEDRAKKIQQHADVLRQQGLEEDVETEELIEALADMTPSESEE